MSGAANPARRIGTHRQTVRMDTCATTRWWPQAKSHQTGADREGGPRGGAAKAETAWTGRASGGRGRRKTTCRIATTAAVAVSEGASLSADTTHNGQWSIAWVSGAGWSDAEPSAKTHCEPLLVQISIQVG